MAVDVSPQILFSNGNSCHFDYALSLYNDALVLKAEQKKNPQELLKLDRWYQNELPNYIKRRGDLYVTHEELVQCMKWKLARGKWRPRLKELVQMNTPRVVLVESKKAFRAVSKRNNITSGIQALCKLKGVGAATASAILTAGLPEKLAYMADEVFEAVHTEDSVNPMVYSTKEYKTMNERIRLKVEELNQEIDDTRWTPHLVEMAVWTHSIMTELSPSFLKDMPNLSLLVNSSQLSKEKNGKVESNGTSVVTTVEKDESSRDTNCSEEDTKDSTNQSGTDESATNSPLQEENTAEPQPKKAKLEED